MGAVKQVDEFGEVEGRTRFGTASGNPGLARALWMTERTPASARAPWGDDTDSRTPSELSRVRVHRGRGALSRRQRSPAAGTGSGEDPAGPLSAKPPVHTRGRRAGAALVGRERDAVRPHLRAGSRHAATLCPRAGAHPADPPHQRPCAAQFADADLAPAHHPPRRCHRRTGVPLHGSGPHGDGSRRASEDR